jgi:hypothetical protein
VHVLATATSPWQSSLIFKLVFTHPNSRFRLLRVARIFWRYLTLLADLLIRKRKADGPGPGGLILRVNERTLDSREFMKNAIWSILNGTHIFCI